MFINISKKTVNRILIILSTLFLLLWGRKWFGPGSATVRADGEFALSRIALSFSDLVWIAVAVVCAGYLLWRYLSYLFWRKYFKGESVPKEWEDPQ